MFAKVITLTLLLTALAGGVMLMRHHRLELANRSAELHREITKGRQDVWNAQGDVAELSRPDRIRHRLDETDTPVAPAVPMPNASTSGGTLVSQ
ncbi:MAG: hypothetical protein GC159_19785 [Phycisphaera sp.]|nr:hypothetical protein [Phycisphaera sp.]